MNPLVFFFNEPSLSFPFEKRVTVTSGEGICSVLGKEQSAAGGQTRGLCRFSQSLSFIISCWLGTWNSDVFGSESFHHHTHAVWPWTGHSTTLSLSLLLWKTVTVMPTLWDYRQIKSRCACSRRITGGQERVLSMTAPSILRQNLLGTASTRGLLVESKRPRNEPHQYIFHPW